MSFATKLTLQAAPYFVQGYPGTPRRLRIKFGSHGFVARTFSSFSDQRARLLETIRHLPKKSRGPTLNLFFGKS